MRVIRLKTGAGTEQDDSQKRAFAFQLRAVKHPATFCEEHLFAEALGRKFRFDFAFHAERLAVEINGGIWSRGAHGHPTTIMRNMEKLNVAAFLGWRVLSFSTQDVKKGIALDVTLATLKYLTQETLVCPLTADSPALPASWRCAKASKARSPRGRSKPRASRSESSLPSSWRRLLGT